MARGDKPYLRKSTDRKAQISLVSGTDALHQFGFVPRKWTVINLSTLSTNGLTLVTTKGSFQRLSWISWKRMTGCGMIVYCTSLHNVESHSVSSLAWIYVGITYRGRGFIRNYTEHKTRGRRPRVLCECFMRGAILDKTKAEVCNPLIFFTPDQPFVTRRWKNCPSPAAK